MSKRNVVLVSCVARKGDEPARAKNLYQSQWFKAARKYAESRGEKWWILSAKWKVVNPNAYLAPYDMTMMNMDRTARMHWADWVAYSLQRMHNPEVDKFTVLAGEHYREYLVPLLRVYGFEVEVPMKGLGIGEQLAWLKANS